MRKQRGCERSVIFFSFFFAGVCKDECYAHPRAFYIGIGWPVRECLAADCFGFDPYTVLRELQCSVEYFVFIRVL